MMAVGYIRVSTEGQAADGLSLEGQRERIHREITLRDWALASLVEEHASAKNLSRRPKLQAMLDHLDAGIYQALIVPRLDRLSRSVGDFAAIMDRANRKGWALVCLDPAVDMTTPYGRAMAQMSAVFAQLERELISQRTKEALAAKRARGEQVGRFPTYQDGDVIAQLLRWDNEHLSLREMCRRLDAMGVPRPSGKPGHWDSSTVGKIIRRERA